ncbi:MAG: RNA polymerase sigma factor [Acidimicrobiales bacterium]
MNDRLSAASSLADIVDGARSGDGRAFELLYGLLHRRVYAYALLRRCPDSEGLVNDVFLQVFTNIARFEGGEAQFRAWLFTIARNKMIDQTRRLNRRPQEVALDDALSERLVSDEQVEREAIGRVANGALFEQLSVLTPEQRDVVLLRVVSDLTVEGVAEVLGKRPGAVKGLQRRALRTLARNISGGDRTLADRSDVPSG